jgi:hypothetical protein
MVPSSPKTNGVQPPREVVVSTAASRPPSPTGCQLRQAARLIAASAHLAHDPVRTWLLLIGRLAALAEAVADLC